MAQPVAIDLCCGLGGWTDGLLAEGWNVVGFDVERHAYGDHRYPAQLVLQDVRTIHGSQLAGASLIVASPPCQEYSYMAMPWTRAKNIAAEYRSGVRDIAKLTELFDACFRIQREAIEVAGHFIPLVVENVRGAQPWVGRSRWNYGSFHLWGDVPALMPITVRVAKRPGHDWNRFKETGEVSPHWRLDGQDSRATKTEGHINQRDGHDHTRHLTNPDEHRATKNDGGSWFAVAHNTTSGKGRNPVNEGVKQGGDWFDDPTSISRRSSSKSSARKAASARIAKIPLPLARHIARVYFPREDTNAR